MRAMGKSQNRLSMSPSEDNDVSLFEDDYTHIGVIYYISRTTQKHESSQLIHFHNNSQFCVLRPIVTGYGANKKYLYGLE